MGLMKWLDKAFNTYQEHLPEIMEFTEKMQENQQKRFEKEQECLEKIEEYKMQYSNLSSQELKERLDTETGLQRKAIVCILQERTSLIRKYKEVYSGLDSYSLRIELHMLKDRATHYFGMEGQKLKYEDAELMSKIAMNILEQRGDI